MVCFIWEIPKICLPSSWQFFLRGVNDNFCGQTNFPPRNAAVQRVPVPKKGRTELEFVMNGMRQKWCIASCCNVLGFYQLLSFLWGFPLSFNQKKLAHFSAEAPAEAPWPLGSRAIPRVRPRATRAPLAVARTPASESAKPAKPMTDAPSANMAWLEKSHMFYG